MNAYQQSSIRFYHVWSDFVNCSSFCILFPSPTCFITLFYKNTKFISTLYLPISKWWSCIHTCSHFLSTNNAFIYLEFLFSSSSAFSIFFFPIFFLSKQMNRNPSKWLKGYSPCFLSIWLSEQQGFLWQKRCKLQSSYWTSYRPGSLRLNQSNCIMIYDNVIYEPGGG